MGPRGGARVLVVALTTWLPLPSSAWARSRRSSASASQQSRRPQAARAAALAAGLAARRPCPGRAADRHRRRPREPRRQRANTSKTVMELSDASLAAQDEHAALLQAHRGGAAFALHRRSRFPPRSPQSRRDCALGRPSTHFGELPADRRERLRTVARFRAPNTTALVRLRVPSRLKTVNLSIATHTQ